MKLDEFIKESVVEIMKGIQTSDEELRSGNLGSIYRGEYERTMAQTLATLRIVKGEGNHGVLVVGFDVAVTVEEREDASDKIEGGIGAILSVVGVKVGANSATSETYTSSNTQRLTFSLPLAISNWGK
jgi:hypothetical protein